jgi:hypothetical protein
VVIGSAALVAIACLAFGGFRAPEAVALFVVFVIFAVHVFHGGQDRDGN